MGMKKFATSAFALAWGASWGLGGMLASTALVSSGTAYAQQSGGQQSGAVALREVDIRAFIEDVSNETGRTFIIDPRVSGRVTVLAQQSMTPNELFDVFQTTLRVNGYVAVPAGSGAYRIVPVEVAAREPAANAGGANNFVTQVFSLHFADAESVANALRPMLSERGQVTTSRRGNSVVVVDYGSTIDRVRSIVGQLDRDNSEFRSVRLRNTSASEMAALARSLSAPAGSENGSLVSAVAVQSSNTLILRGDARAIDDIARLVGDLDSDADFEAGVQVIPLRYAVAEELVPILQQVSGAITDQANGGAQASTRNVNIASHQSTNSLIISADRETQEALANVVRSLDVRRQQILVEAIIVEVSDDAARELGLQFFAADPTGDNAVPFLSTSYANNSAANLLTVTGALIGDGASDETSDAVQQLQAAAVSSLIGSSGLLLGAGGTNNDGVLMGLILNALAEDTESNVLSTPSVMTLDNETAHILVGQQIPITTGEALSDNFQNQFRTVQRQDVGVKLEVRPQISEGGAIRLEIKQEVSSVFGPVITSSADLITNQREINTVVQVDAGQIIVLGGLIQEDVQSINSGVPGLRNIPIAGRLFSNDSRTRTRTNLMVFLRPTIVTTPEQASAVTAAQYRTLRGYGGLDRAIADRLDREIGIEPETAPVAPAPANSNSGGRSVSAPPPAPAPTPSASDASAGQAPPSNPVTPP